MAFERTNTNLVEYAKHQIGRPYWFGTFGNICNATLWKNKQAQYPKYYTSGRTEKAKAHYGKKAHDCIGLFKGFLWGDTFDGETKYRASEDWSADMTYNKATEKGTINTIPEIVGLFVWRKGHIGVYIGNGEVIEAKGFDYGVVKSQLKGSSFTHWGKHPLITYTSEAKAVTEHSEGIKSDVSTYTIVSGDTLTKIAKKFGTTVDAIMKLNPQIKDKNKIKAGDKIVISSAQKVDAKPVSKVGTVITQNSNLNIRAKADIKSVIVGELIKGKKYDFSEVANGWCKLADGRGYVSATYIRF